MESAEKMLKELGVRAKKASRELNRLGVKRKNEGLEAVAKALILHQDKILAANEKDVKKAKENQMKESLVDRLSLTEERIEAMAEGLTQIVALEDPVGEVSEMKTSPLGMQIGQKRVPLGVIGIIYESRPNVTADAFGLCFKTGNAVILRGGSDALNSNLDIPAEDARMILPNACTTCIEVKMNLRSLMNFMNERLCSCAPWEIRELAMKMRDAVVEKVPELADYLVPKCEKYGKEFGFCNESKSRSCGRHPRLKEIFDCYNEFKE